MSRGGWKAGASLLAIAVAAFVMLGLADGSLGVAWPSIRSGLNRDLSDLGIVLAAGSIGYLTSSIGYGSLHGRLGTGIALGLGTTSMALALGAFAVALSWWVIVLAALIFGVGAGVVDSGMNAHAALEFDVRSINLLHASYGLGATAGPLVMTVSLTAGAAWRGGYAALMLAQAGIAGVVWWTRRSWLARSDETADTVSPVRAGLLSIGAMLLLFLVYTGVEVATGQWAFTLLTESRSMPTAAAGAWVAAYWGGLTAGRFISSFFGDRLSPSRILDTSMVVALAGLGVLWWDPGGLGYLGLPVAGMGFAATFPTLVSLTPARIGRSRSTRMVGYQLAAANIGAASLPWALGLFAQASGLDVLAPGIFGSALLLALIHLGVDRTSRHRARPIP